MSVRLDITLHACGPGCRLDGIVGPTGMDLNCMVHGPLTFVRKEEASQ